MANSDQTEIAELASNLWDNYFKDKLDAMTESNVSFYRAQVIDVNSDDTMTVRAAYDVDHKVRFTNEIAEAEPEEEIVVLKFGHGDSANNNVATLRQSYDGQWTWRDSV